MSRRFFAASKQFINRFSMQFDGILEYLDFGDVADFDNEDPFSLSLWYNPSVASTRQFLATRNENTADFKGWQTLREADDTIQFLLVHDVDPANFILVTTNTTISDSVFTHVVITFDGSSASGVKIYFNGVSQALTTLSDTLTLTTLNTSTLQFARRNDSTGHINGFLDEPSIWNKELSAGEVGLIYNNGVPNNLRKLSFAGNLIVWPQFTQTDINNFPTIKDHSINVDDGAAVNMQATDIQDITP